VGIAASPSVSLASGTPSSTLFENTPPSAKTDCATPSSRNANAPINLPSTKTIRQPPKKAISRRASTRGNCDRSLIKRNSSAGSATPNTKRPSASLTGLVQPPQSASKWPGSTSRKSGAASATWCRKDDTGFEQGRAAREVRDRPAAPGGPRFDGAPACIGARSAASAGPRQGVAAGLALPPRAAFSRRRSP
jgi:hypothetical protein